MIRLGALFGGKSGEHEVSLMSASSILRAIDRTKYTCDDRYYKGWRVAAL